MEVKCEENFQSCDECGMDFKDADVLRKHANVHSKLGRFVCKLCGYNYTSAINLQKHKNVSHV